MYKGKLTRDEAIAAVGLDTIETLDYSINAEPTSRCDDMIKNDGVIEYEGSVIREINGEDAKISVFFYPEMAPEDCDDSSYWDNIDWGACKRGYEIETV